MRFGSMLAAAAMLTAATPAFAATIVQDLTARQTFGDTTPFDINGAPFNPALGTLTAATAKLTGFYTPEVALSAAGPPPPSPGILSTTYSVIAEPPNGGSPGGNVFRGTLPSQTVIPGHGGYDFLGTPAFVTLSFDFPTLSTFISSAPGPVTLALFGFNSTLADRATLPPTDATTFDGTFALTYTYNAATAVPEPASLFILGIGAGLIPLLKRRRAV